MTEQTSDKPMLSKDQAELLFAQFALIASSHGWSEESIGKIARLQDYCLATFRPSLAAQAGPEVLRPLLEANEAVMEKFVAEFEWDAGEDGYHNPTDEERILIGDAIAGLHADDDFVRTFNAWQDAVRGHRPPTPASGETPRTAKAAVLRWDEVDQSGFYIPLGDARQLERELRKLEMEMPDYKQCCDLREKAERELAEAQSATPAHLTAVEFGYRCAEKGMNLQAALSASTDESSKT